MEKFNTVVVKVSFKSRFLMIFQGEYEKDLVLNCITVVTVYRIPVTKLSKVHIIFTKP